MYNGIGTRAVQVSGRIEHSHNAPPVRHELDGVPVKLADRFQPISRVTLPLNVDNKKIIMDQFEYDFSLEMRVLEEQRLAKVT